MAWKTTEALWSSWPSLLDPHEDLSHLNFKTDSFQAFQSGNEFGSVFYEDKSTDGSDNEELGAIGY